MVKSLRGHFYFGKNRTLSFWYNSFGHSDFILCLGYKNQVVKDFFLNYEAHTKDFTIKLGQQKAIEFHTDHDESDWRVTLADTGLNSMTGARIKKIRKYVGDGDFMLTYGDGVGDIDINRLLEFHQSHGKVLTITGVRPPGRFGELVDKGGTVTTFNEKPQTTGGRISGGFFVVSSRLFEYLNDDDGLVFEQGPMCRLVADGEVMVYEHNDF